MRRRLAVAAGALAVVGVGGIVVALRSSSGSPLDADERAVVEEVESGSHDDAGDAARFVDEHVAVLLSADVAGEVDGSDLAALFGLALDGDAGDGVFETVVSAVAEEGAIHGPALRPVFSEAAAARLAWFDPRINAPFLYTNIERLPEVREPSRAAYVFLRETMRDPAAAERLRRSMAAYGLAEVAAAPAAGEERESRLRGVGRVQGFFTDAHYAAELRQARVDGNGESERHAEEADQERRAEDAADQAAWVALDRFESDPAVRAEAEGEAFVDADGALKDDLTEGESEELQAWAMNEALEGGLLWGDVGGLSLGNAEVRGDV